jgi:penicillin-binding protein 2
VSYLANKSEVREFSLSLQIALAIMGAAMIVFAGRLWYLQLFKGEEYRVYAEQIATTKRAKPAPRGMILDTTGQRLADNRASFDLKVTFSDVPDEFALAVRLGDLLAAPPEDVKDWFDKAKLEKGYTRYQPALVRSDLMWPEVAKIESFKADLPGVEIDTGIKRTYLYGDLFAHQIGYLGEVGEKDLAELQKKYGPDLYQRGHYWGKEGIEQQWEETLKGRDGKRIAAKDRLGRELSEEDAGRLLEDFKSLALSGTDEIPGNNVRLGIDLGLQQEIARAFGSQSGAVVVVDVKTGLIRALFDNPSVDPEIFARGINQTEWDALSNNPDHPLEDKALRGMYPPGSTFKLLVAAAGLGTGEITPKTTFTCNGSFHFGNRQYRCWNKNGHGVVDLHKAIQQSCDVFFYNVGLKVGVDRLAAYAKSFGLGEATGIGINNEKKGLMPTSEWKRVAKREEWQEGETLSMAIGQGYDLVTPLQLAMTYAAFANGGHVLEPHLVEQVVAPDGKVVFTTAPKERHKANITPDDLKLLQDGLYAVVNEPGGTGWYGARMDEIHISGKTGTAQVIQQTERDQSLKMGTEFQDHAWFAAYAPSENPEIAMAILVEHGKHGASAAAPIAKAICEYWFRDEVAAKRAEKTEKKVATASTPPAPGTTVAKPTPTPVPTETLPPAPPPDDGTIGD